MNTKIAVAVVAALVVVAGGYYLYMRPAPSDTTGVSQGSGVPSSGKLDINVVCQSALAYMTFADAASADLFIQECKDGKHPEVIERYRADIGYGDGAAI